MLPGVFVCPFPMFIVHGSFVRASYQLVFCFCFLFVNFFYFFLGGGVGGTSATLHHRYCFSVEL